MPVALEMWWYQGKHEPHQASVLSQQNCSKGSTEGKTWICNLRMTLCRVWVLITLRAFLSLDLPNWKLEFK